MYQGGIRKRGPLSPEMPLYNLTDWLTSPAKCQQKWKDVDSENVHGANDTVTLVRRPVIHLHQVWWLSAGALWNEGDITKALMDSASAQMPVSCIPAFFCSHIYWLKMFLGITMWCIFCLLVLQLCSFLIRDQLGTSEPLIVCALCMLKVVKVTLQI